MRLKTNLLYYFPVMDPKLQAQPAAAPSNVRQPAMPIESCQVSDSNAYCDTLQQDSAAVDYDQILDTFKPLPEEI